MSVFFLVERKADVDTRHKENEMSRISGGLHSVEYKTIDGLKIRFAKNGRSDGVPILLLSPLPESILAFLPTWDMFSALGPLIAVDLPAFGQSESRSYIRA